MAILQKNISKLNSVVEKCTYIRYYYYQVLIIDYKKRGTFMNAGIIGLGKYVPEKVVTNDDLEKIIDTSDEWISTRLV